MELRTVEEDEEDGSWNAEESRRGEEEKWLTLKRQKDVRSFSRLAHCVITSCSASCGLVPVPLL